jgi:hypothetical protein
MGERRQQSRRHFRPQIMNGLALESRQLPASLSPGANLPIRNNPAPNRRLVDFDHYEFVGNERDGFAEVTLRRTNTTGELRVTFSTDPAAPGSPYDAVSVPVTFKDGQATASVAVPLHWIEDGPPTTLVGLHIPPETPGWYAITGRSDPSLPARQARRAFGPPAVLHVVDRAEIQPPQIVSAEIDRTGVTLTFSEPMDKAKAEDVRNYVVQRYQMGDKSWWRKASIFINNDSDKLIRLNVKSATYEEATNSVHLNLGGQLTATRYVISSPNQTGAHRIKPLQPARTLTDVAGNALASDLTKVDGVAQGTFRYIVRGAKES